MPDPDDEFRVSPVGGAPIGRALPVITFLVGLLLGAAIVKPWDILFPTDRTVIAAPSTTGVGPRPAPTGTPSASPTPLPDDCAFAGGWRVFAVGQRDPLGGDGSTLATAPPSLQVGPPDITNPLRRWIEIVPFVGAAGPTDSDIPFVIIVSERIAGLSYCPPRGGTDGPPPGATFTAWRVGDAGSEAGSMTAVPLSLRRATLDQTSSIEVPVYVIDDDTATEQASWPPGRYVFAIATPGDATDGRWFGVDIQPSSGRVGG